METASVGLFRAKWTEKIHDEWISNLLAKRSDLDPAKLERTRYLMNSAVPDCLVTGYESIIDSVDLPDENDRHILAAAIHCGADAIVTFNLKDFPGATLSIYHVEPQHPDDFLVHQFSLNQVAVLHAARRCRSRLKRNPRSADQYLLALERCGLPRAVAHLRGHSEVI
jgi:hypothetical protein